MNAHQAESVSTVELIRRVDGWARACAEAWAGELELTT